MADGGGIAPAAAAAELLRRRRARESLADFAQAVTIPGAPVSEDEARTDWLFRPVETTMAAHHRLLLAKVQQCLEEESGRLMVFMPPGSAKSTYASVVAPAWAMGRWTGYKVVLASYAATPAERQSRRCRAIVSSPEYTAIWPERIGLKAGSAAVNEWDLTNDSTMLAVGVLGAVTSARADALLIDDPVAGREEANSETIRRKTREAYDDDLLTRLKPHGSVILIQTRWHPDDLAGSILPEDWDGQSGRILCRDGLEWEVVCLPAQADRSDDPLGRQPGEYLWPEWFPETHWQQHKVKARTWASLYQQRPRPESGNQFERDDFVWYDPEELPERLNMYGASDFAVTEKDLEKNAEPDYTEHGIAGMDEDRVLWLVDWWSGQKELDESVRNQLALIRQHKPLRWFGEKGAQENSVKPIRRLLARESDTFANFENLPHVGDKVAKVQAFRAMVKEGRVRLPRKPWAMRLVDQLTSFPRGRFDDAVDVCGLLGRGVDEMRPAHRPAVQKRAGVKPFTSEWLHASEKRPAVKPSYYR